MDWASMVFPGEFCHATGIYRVTHFQHRLPHDVSISEAEKFPVCKKCHSKVRYQKLESVDPSTVTEPIGEDPDLSIYYSA